MVVTTPGEEVSIVDFLEIQRGKEARRSEFCSLGENVLIKSVEPIGIFKKGGEIKRHVDTLVETLTTCNRCSLLEIQIEQPLPQMAHRRG